MYRIEALRLRISSSFLRFASSSAACLARTDSIFVRLLVRFGHLDALFGGSTGSRF